MMLVTSLSFTTTAFAQSNTQYNPTVITETTISTISLSDGIIDYWYSFTPTADKKYEVSMTGILATDLTGIAIYKDTYANDEFTITTNNGTNSCAAAADLKAGSTYLIEVVAITDSPSINITIKEHIHTYRTALDQAMVGYDGAVYNECIAQDAPQTIISTIPSISSVKLSKKSYTYNGKVKKPTVTIKDRNGAVLKSGTDYTLTYQKGRKNVGEYYVAVEFKGNYYGYEELTFKVQPKSTKIQKVTKPAKKQIKVSWSKQTSQTTGYQVQYSTSKSFKNAKSKTVSGNKKTSVTIKGLKSNKKYYVKVRTYKTITDDYGDKKKIYSSWSAVKTVKTK